MCAPLQILLPDLVALIQAHFDPLYAKVNFPGTYATIANIKVVDHLDILRHEFTHESAPPVLTLMGEILYGAATPVLLEISEPQPDPALEDAFRWELVARFNIPPELDPEEWLTVNEGRRAWGEWTTWHDHTRVATIWADS